MDRYCIVCKTKYGCIKGGIKHVCHDCDAYYNCTDNDNISISHTTGGICEECWGKRNWIRLAIKVYNIAGRLGLKPLNTGINNISPNISGSFPLNKREFPSFP